MCVTCIQNRCNDLSEYIFELKDIFTDEQFKYMLDSCKFIFDKARCIEESYTNQNDNEEEDEEDEEEEYQHDLTSVFKWNQPDDSTLCAIQQMFTH